MQLDDLYADFVAVLRSAPHGDTVLDSVVLPYESREVAVADILAASCDLSLATKLAQKEYSDPYAFYHDLKLSFGRLIAQFPQNDEAYAELSQLFKFSADLLVREASRLGLLQPSWNEDDEHLFRLSQGFSKIGTELQSYNAETFWVTAGNGPLFMSMTDKAPIDPRDTAVAGSVHTVKLLPHLAKAPDSTLGFVSPLNQNFPQPFTAPSDLLSRFVHPNRHPTMPPTWMGGVDGYNEFAPKVDSSVAVVSERDAMQLWLEQGTHQPTERRRLSEDVNEQSNQEVKGEQLDANAAHKQHDNYAELSADLDVNSDLQLPTSDSSAGSLTSRELEALLRWSPYTFIDDDEIEAASNGTEYELVSRLLLTLQMLQKQRLNQPDADQEVGEEERHVALKINNLLARLVSSSDPESYKLPLDTRLPVLMRNYTGSLPQATDPAMQMQMNGMASQSNGRLQTLASLRQRARPSRK